MKNYNIFLDNLDNKQMEMVYGTQVLPNWGGGE